MLENVVEIVTLPGSAWTQITATCAQGDGAALVIKGWKFAWVKSGHGGGDGATHANLDQAKLNIVDRQGLLRSTIMQREQHFARGLRVRPADRQLVALTGELEIETVSDLAKIHIERTTQVS